MREIKALKAVSYLEDAKVLDPIIDRVRATVLTVLRPRALRDILHGVPVGHPVHPVAVLVPAGAWISSGILDLVPGAEKQSRILVVAGVLGAVPAIASGFTDWSQLHKEQQRVGIIHSAANLLATGLYVASYVQRGRGHQASGKVLGFAGLAVVSGSGYLGGHLAYRQAAGANHVEDVPHRFPDGWQPVGLLEELPDGQLTKRTVGEVPLVVLRRGPFVDVLSNTCSHLGGPLDEGSLTTTDGEQCVTCPWHGSVFSMRSGEVVGGPATSPQHRFESRVVADRVEVRLP
ncbi:MAG: hypothetical protein JWM50_2197 [Microbacteriaceae bacterium]|nr:hypothetical protein [Microbacteriaceae bacterium]